MRVAHIVPTDRIAYLLLRARLQRLQQAGVDISILCGRAPQADGETTDYIAELRHAGFSVHILPFAREPQPLTDLRCVSALFSVLRRQRYDIVHSHNPKGGMLGPPVARLAGGSVVMHTVHGFLFHDAMGAAIRYAALAAERWTAAWSQHLLFQSREDYDYAGSHGFGAAGHLHLVGNGIDEKRFDLPSMATSRSQVRTEFGWSCQHRVIGMVGRLVREKGFVEFFQMAGQLSRSHPRCRFFVVGIPEPEQSDTVDPHKLADEQGISQHCTIVQMRHDMPQLYAAMDVAVLPSRREGLSRALMEASGMGLAVVASNIRGCRELVIDQQTGRLVPVGDVDAFASAVAGFVEDDAHRQACGERGRQHILAQYTETAVAGRVLDCYRQALIRN